MNEFLHHLHDTVILLGGTEEIANMLLCPDLLDRAATDTLRQYNIDLSESLKERLGRVNTIQFEVVGN